MAKVNFSNLKDNSFFNTDDSPLSNKMENPGRPRIKRLTTGTVLKKEKPLLARMFGETAREVGGYVIWDVIIPALKEVITDVVTNGIEMLVYGDASRHSRSGRLRRERGRSYVSYSSMYDSPRAERIRDTRRAPSNRHAFDKVVLESRSDAELVLDGLAELISTYGGATVADFYSAVGLPVDYNDNKYGWDSLATSSVERVRGGYILVMPRPIYFED